MKFNKWTVGLASVGLVSLASAARAEEKVSVIQTALASTTISGYVDTSAQWNFGTGNERLPAYKFGGPTKADGFNLDVVQLRIEKPLDEADWAAGYRVDLWFGPDANVLGTQSSGTAADFALRQAYIALRAPILPNGLDFKVGVFDSIIGYESVESGANPNYTRSYGHSFEPQTHTGVLLSYRCCEMVAISGGIANTKGPQINGRAFNTFAGDDETRSESSKTYMASIAITAPDSLGFLAGSTFYAGIVSGYDNNEPTSNYDRNSINYYAGCTLASPVAGLRFGGAFDYLDVANTSGETWSLAGYASYQATEKLSVHARAEYLRDRGDQKAFVVREADGTIDDVLNPDRVLALTGTVQYDLWKNVISRVEVRWDHSLSGQKTWGNITTGETGTSGGLRNEFMLAANLIYKF